MSLRGRGLFEQLQINLVLFIFEPTKLTVVLSDHLAHRFDRIVYKFVNLFVGNFVVVFIYKSFSAAFPYL